MQNKKQEKTYFDKFTKEEPWHTFTARTYNKIIKLFLGLNPKKNDVISDMGCGTGELTNKIRNHSKNVSGFDISKNCILMARKHYSSINFKVRDIENTKLKDISVEFYCGVLHHFTDIKKVIKEAKGYLRKMERYLYLSLML